MTSIKQMWRATMAALVLTMGAAVGADGAPACAARPEVHDAQGPREVRAYFEAQKRKVVTFFGYSGAGYEDDAAMLAVARATLRRFDPRTTIVNIGATADGIGAVYGVAKERGFTTTGIVSSEARREKVALAPCVDVVFFVTDTTWGGYVDATKKVLSPTSQAMVENSDVLVAIGGGEVSRDELSAALSRGKKAGRDVHFFAADMSHARARERAAKRGQPAPQDFEGAVAPLFRTPARR
jgi:hypothetical protein